MKLRSLRAMLTVGLTLFMLASASSVLAQNAKVKGQEATKTGPNGIALVRFIDLPGSKYRLIVDLGAPEDSSFAVGAEAQAVADARAAGTAAPQDPDLDKSDLRASNITIKFLPSGKVVPQAVINNQRNHPTAANTTTIPAWNNKRLQIGLIEPPDSDPNHQKSVPDPGDDRVEVTFGVLHFAGNVERKNVVGTGKIYNRANIADRVEETRQALKDAVAHAKTDEEKDAFIGLNIVVPSGGNSQGSGDINFNKDIYASTLGQAALFDHLQIGFHLNKASETKSDPRHFDFGFTLRKTFLRADSQTLRTISDAINNGRNSELESREVVNGISKLQNNFVRAFIFDNALRFEGDVSDRGISNVSNLLWDTQLQVATVSRALAGQTGFWNFRFVPVGFEVGGNLTNNDDPMQEKHSLARLKSGGEFNLIFNAGDPNEPISRIQITAKALERYLFRSETTLDEMTQKAIMTDKGSKYWLQADVKVGTGVKIGAGRVGFKLTFERGFLPPVYNFVKTFKFGVVFETNDDDNSGNLKVKK